MEWRVFCASWRFPFIHGNCIPITQKSTKGIAFGSHLTDQLSAGSSRSQPVYQRPGSKRCVLSLRRCQFPVGSAGIARREETDLKLSRIVHEPVGKHT